MNAPQKMPNQIAEIRSQLHSMEGQFKAALPAHIPVERFARVVMTAIQNNTDLLECSRRSLWNAAMKAAQDGLLPDGRDGAIVPYKGEAQWMPMIAGLRKKVRNSGEIETWDAHVVYANDDFEYQLGDEPFIRHRPRLDGDRGAIIAAYSIATLKGGEKSREVMSIIEIEGVRSKSRGKNTPWNDPVFYPEMCRKTVARRHSKVLPMSTDLDDLIGRDDDLYDLHGAREEAQADRPKSLAGRLDALASSAPENGNEVEDVPDGEVIEHKGSQAAADDAEQANEGGDDVGNSDGRDTPKVSEASEQAPAEASRDNADDAGPDFDPDTWLSELETALSACQDQDTLDRVWNENGEAVIEAHNPFPPDKQAARDLYTKHAKRVAG